MIKTRYAKPARMHTSANPSALLPLVRHAGAIFCGPWSPAAMGDYAAGPSHVLPTNSTARFSSVLSLRDFQKEMHAITFDRSALRIIADANGSAKVAVTKFPR